MLKKTLITLVLSSVLILWVTPMALGADTQVKHAPFEKLPSASLIPARDNASYTPVGAVTGEVNRVAGAKDFCSLYGAPVYAITDWFMGQEWYANYQDPEEYGCVNVWPFEVITVGFNIVVDHAFTFDVQGFVLDADLSDPTCPVPGGVLCQTPMYQVAIPGAGHWIISLPMVDMCCVYGVYFAAIYLPDDISAELADAVSEDDVNDVCRSYNDYGNGWEDLVVQYGWPGEMLLWSEGYTEPQNDCPDWPNHKMHFPQLPDLEGWDVHALFPKTLADDWRCSATGEVLDIHFWGSWKDIDGDPYTDDFYTPMPWFQLSIHRNIPADADTNWSRPGEQIWYWEGEIPGAPFEPPAMEHWFNPNTGEVLYNDHVPYWRYDFFFDQAVPPPEPFFQYKDTIYWLNVSAMGIPEPYEWGWKSSRDHFADDATYTDNPPGGPWFPLYEPPRANWFDVYFNSAGEPEDMESTNYYGAGWYRYEYWWNMWFYNNPFVPNPKHIWLEFNVDPVGPTPYVEFAINWSTDLWSIEGEPGRPPLPGDDETLYIGREIFPVSLGPNTIDFWIDDYNPEWVSIDFVATDVVINGWIWHECMETSMDLAFVITGEEAPPDTGRNHYKTWMFEWQPFGGTVIVQDQFMEDYLELAGIQFLSNPVKKVVDSDTFDIIKPDDHLTWYRAFGRDTLIEVEYVNQFESTTVVIDLVEWLLVPTQKEGHAPPESLDHYKAYHIQDPVEFPVQFSLEDQFDVWYGEPEFIDSLKPIYFLTPAIKNMEQPQLFDSVTHYVAYLIVPTRYYPLYVYTWDQFGEHYMYGGESMLLLVPSKKGIVPPCDPPSINCPDDEIQNQNGVYTTTTQWTADDGNPADPAVNLTSVAVDLAMLPPGISAASVNFTGCVPGPGCKSTNGTVTYTVSDHCRSGGPIYLIATNNCPPPNADTCSFVVALTNDPPAITQPDSLEGYVNSVVQYDITGNDPNGDVINDVASIQIVPPCGSYSIIRTSGGGTSSGTWQITWNTFGCTACQTYLVIHDLTDACGATSYCTTKVHLSEEVGWYWKPDYEDYAPSGIPDIDQRQDAWIKFDTEQWSFCGPVAVANCFKWFDSKYNQPNPGAPGDGMDQFPLVRDYLDNLPPFVPPATDDHDPWNVDHVATPWMAACPPPLTPQPFVPGPQPQPSPMPPWGELVERLACYFNTDGCVTGYCAHTGTNIMEMQAGIDNWFKSETLVVSDPAPDTSTIADSLYERTWAQPTFAWVETLVEKSQDVILLLGFWYEDPPGSGEWWRIGGHYVTVAGVNSDEFMIAFSDPFIDAAEMGIAPGRIRDGSLIPHPHGAHDPTIHNDEGNVSHDIYMVAFDSPSPGGVWWLPEYPVMWDPLYWSWNFSNQNVPDEFVPVTRPWNEISPIFTEVEYAVEISPWEYPPDCGDVNRDGVVNVADAVYLVTWLFMGGPAPPVRVKADVNHDGFVNIADAVYILTYLFAGGPPPQCFDP